MSRVDDDREAQRALERQLQRLREADRRGKARAAEASAFAQKMQQGQRVRHQAATEQVGAELQSHEEARAEEEQLLSAELGAAQEAEAETSARSGQGFTARLKANAAVARERGADTDAFAGRQAAAGQGSLARAQAGAQGRREDGGRRDEAFRERQGALRKSSEGLAADGAGPEDGLGADRAGERGEGGGSQEDEGQERGGQPGAFRLNPALMAPVAVVKPKVPSASERLRALATEIAQKIVEKVWVGRNAAGVAEFQIDLKSNVLSGLSIKVSGANGRIRATFSGRDREVLQLLKNNSDGLKRALEGRGLQLEALTIEGTA